uniref:USP domain-containing protein n=1 Tax=Ditylenchus dipsaci TaxID=166011 RepID=A0A915EI19_9BILA
MMDVFVKNEAMEGTTKRFALSISTLVVNHDGESKQWTLHIFCEKPVEGQWLKFDDEQCTWVDSSNVVTSKAFIL